MLMLQRQQHSIAVYLRDNLTEREYCTYITYKPKLYITGWKRQADVKASSQPAIKIQYWKYYLLPNGFTTDLFPLYF